MAHVLRQPADIGNLAHYDLASRPKCLVVLGGGGAADTGVILADQVDQAEAAEVVARVKTKGQVAQEEHRGVTQNGSGVNLPGQRGRFVGSRSVGGV